MRIELLKVKAKIVTSLVLIVTLGSICAELV